MRAFARCNECGHEGIMRMRASADADMRMTSRDGHDGVQRAACGLCGGTTIAADAPADVFSGWRCQCYHCVSTPC